jgi:ATP-dependent helicase/nuclease subunit A
MKDGSWYDLAARAARKMGVPIARGDETLMVIGDADTENFEGDARKPEDRVAVADWVRKKPALETIRPRLIHPSDAAGQEEPAMLSPRGKGAARFRRGNLIHALLARLPNIAPDKRRNAALRFLAARQVENEDAAKLVDETLAVIDDPRFAAAFAPNSRAEIALAADLPELGDGARLNGRIDRLAVTDSEVLAIDFKTNRPPPKTPDAVSTLYLTQMALYRAALAKVFPRHRIACALVWTEGPSLMPLPDALLDTEIARIPARLDSTAPAS